MKINKVKKLISLVEKATGKKVSLVEGFEHDDMYRIERAISSSIGTLRATMDTIRSKPMINEMYLDEIISKAENLESEIEGFSDLIDEVIQFEDDDE